MIHLLPFEIPTVASRDHPGGTHATDKRVIFVAAMMLVALPVAAQTPSTLETVKKRGQVICGVNRPGRLLAARQPGQMERPRRRHVPRGRRRRAGRRRQGQVRAAQLAAALPRPAVGRDRRAVAQLDHDADARRVARHQYSPASTTSTARASWSPKKLGVEGAARSSTARPSACSAGTTSEKNMADYFRAGTCKYKPVVFETAEDDARARSSPAAARSTRPTCVGAGAGARHGAASRTTTWSCRR